MPIQTTEIQPGDMLLFHGKGFISWAIRKFDGTEVNHAAIALPDGRLAEAAGTGLVERPIPTTFSSDDYMLVRSHTSTNARDPVVATAEQYVAEGHFYGYQQIVLLAALGMARQIPARGLARRLLRAALDHASRALMDLLPVGANWMICSEYVYRCFDEALDTTPDPFAVDIAGLTYETVMGGQDTWLDWAFANASDLELKPPVTFTALETDPDAAAEAELAPLIAEWARYVDVDETDPLPAGAAPAVFAAPADADDPQARADAEALQRDEVPDADLQESMVRFSQTLTAARATAPGIPVQFGVVPGAVVGAAAKGALKGLATMAVDPNFVTPGDLLKSRSFTPAERAQ